MNAYRIVTGRNNLREFWKMSPAELFAWVDVIYGDTGDMFENLEVGEEVED